MIWIVASVLLTLFNLNRILNAITESRERKKYLREVKERAANSRTVVKDEGIGAAEKINKVVYSLYEDDSRMKLNSILVSDKFYSEMISLASFSLNPISPEYYKHLEIFQTAFCELRIIRCPEIAPMEFKVGWLEGYGEKGTEVAGVIEHAK